MLKWQNQTWFGWKLNSYSLKEGEVSEHKQLLLVSTSNKMGKKNKTKDTKSFQNIGIKSPQ